ncbi:MAG: hypothetical protein HUU30_01305 [Burkholderiaceae bacterium]|nr:hypothetical protein [Aquabacterium sp.]NUP84383.1 hypothetical protein [Burkholderiaceae bacterium]
MTHADTPSPGIPGGDTEDGRAPALLHGRTDCLQALRQALLHALDDGSADVWWVDPDFVDWPLDDSEVLDALTHWARLSGRTLHLIGGQFDAMVRRHPRFTRWRRDWAHRLEVSAPVDIAQAADLPTLVVSVHAGIEVLDRVQWRARPLSQPQQVKQSREVCETWRQHCEAAWPATTLGL